MGNCVFKGSGGLRTSYDKDDLLIKVVTPNGGVMELHPPIFADYITNEYPGHVIHDTLSLRHSSPPLLHGEELFPGNIYYLLPISSAAATASTTQQHSSDQSATPFRMSIGKTPVKAAANGGGSGVWKVRLVISPEQLADILAEDVETEAFVESVRTVAKCGGYGGANWRATSDQLSVTSSFKGQLR
ncbi:hypothetical protein EUTSA_v10006365mg [Eutrema salsugineum]|uniref:Uncharacterized protein n=1 Tax=Eutrema salsugineum TaxID=72664 RepID=V4LN28_EUTSA|nr:uncharacterized protein LOC18020306 [Eutrema salsugineum]ESQ43882.1 hypothetical protein EUTSA_v10006365mg [Eutrema salsugineum]